ncbi:hypothetical protein [Streptomyces sp. LN325]|uniref:hypothetical protein n=1 Tax=Streptomyces sp. LN325 TaxID=3112976 RepID=UPI0037206E49
MAEQKTPTPQQVTEALYAAPPIVLAPGPREAPTQIPPVPHDVWDLPGGTAWVYYGEGKHGLTRPVIIADGFNSGPSDIGMLWEGLDRREYAFLSEIRRSGRDVVIVGFHERSAPIQHHGRAALAAIERATHHMSGGHGLAVGGFSMGGLVTRYALLKLEHRRTDHRTELYFSYDSPHRGAWIPIGLQAFAHYIRDLDDRFSGTAPPRNSSCGSTSPTGRTLPRRTRTAPTSWTSWSAWATGRPGRTRSAWPTAWARAKATASCPATRSSGARVWPSPAPASTPSAPVTINWSRS